LNKQKVYIETSFISYLTSKPSRDLIIAAHQQVTQFWWEERRKQFDIYISQLIYEEASKEDLEAARSRIEIISDLPLLELNESTYNLANNFILSGIIPAKYVEDAFHIAIATVHGMDYLLTWNCKHIANAAIRSEIERISREDGYICPIICTPEELIGE